MRLTKSLCCFYLVLFSTVGLTQTEHDHSGEFAYVQNENGLDGDSDFIADSKFKKTQAFKTADAVFQKLIEARGDFRMRRPTLVISNAQRRVAVAKPKSAEIELELKAFEVCMSFGKDSLNALAAILAHELIHYYEKHDWTNHFAKHHGDMQTGMVLKSLDEGLKLETQADYLGGFLAYSAGFQVLDIMPDFLSKVYQAYGLPDKIKGYPSLWDRRKIASKSLERLKDLVHLYDMANHFIILEQYKNAKTYLDLVSKDFQSRELYNNLGVAASQAAMQYMNANDLRFAFPLELDPDSRLKNTMRGNASEEMKQSLLKEAWIYFEQAIQLDKDYPIALLNIACVFTFLENFDDANFYLSKGLKKCTEEKHAKTKSDILVLKGILAAKEKNNKEAEAYFSQAINMGNQLAATNLKVLKEEDFDVEPVSRIEIKKMKIDSLDLDRFITDLYRGDFTADKIITVNKEILYGQKEYPSSKVHVHLEQDSGDYTIFHGYDGSEGVKLLDAFEVGTPMATIHEKIGKGNRKLGAKQSSYEVYYQYNLVLESDAENNLKTWSLFRIAK